MLFMMSYNGLRRVLKLQCSGIMNFWCSPESANPSYFRFFLGMFLSVFRLFRVFSYFLGCVLRL